MRSAPTAHATEIAAAAAADEPMEILVAEAPRATRPGLEAFLTQQGHRVLYAASGEEAVRLFDPRLDLVLMDVVMPGTDGIEVTHRLRSASGERWVPVVLLSAVGEESAILRGLEAGADDYLVRPINFAILQAKMRSFRRIAELHRQSMELGRALATCREHADAELQIATSLIGSLAQQEGLRDPMLSWRVLPSSRFSGDTVAAVRTPSGRLLVMLADATGHGLPAAISLLPALQVFYGTARKDLPVPEVVREMNRRMREYLSAGFYLAAILLSVDSASRRVQVWNGGMPPGLWLRDGIEVPTDVLDSCHLPLGILDDQQFDASCRSLSCAGGGQLVLYSDGLVEAADARGEAFGVRRLRDLLAGRSGEEGMRLTLEVLTSHLGGHPARDDISLVTVALA